MSKGSFTTERAASQGLIEAPPIGAALKRWKERNEVLGSEDGERDEGSRVELGFGPIQRMVFEVGVNETLLYRLMQGEKRWIEFDIADKIISLIDPTLWHTDPELSRIYQAFNFTHLDLQRPVADDGLGELVEAGIPGTVIARLYGVSKRSIYTAIAARDAVAA